MSRAARWTCLVALAAVVTSSSEIRGDEQNLVVGYAVFAGHDLLELEDVSLAVNARGTPDAATGSVEYVGYVPTKEAGTAPYGTFEGAVDCVDIEPIEDRGSVGERRIWLNGAVTDIHVTPGEPTFSRFTILIFQGLEATGGGNWRVANESLYVDMSDGVPWLPQYPCYQHGRYLYTASKQRGMIVAHAAR